jgi:hypothetical protein
VKQGYAKSQWLDLGVKLLGQSYARGRPYVRYKIDGSELNSAGGTYLLNKLGGVWRIGVLLGYPIKDAHSSLSEIGVRGAGEEDHAAARHDCAPPLRLHPAVPALLGIPTTVRLGMGSRNQA